MLTVKTIQKIERETTLVVPCFFKEPSIYPTTYLGVLDDNTLISFYIADGYATIKNASPKQFFIQDEIDRAYNTWQSCTEEEFMAMLEKAIEAVSLTQVK